MHKWFFLLTSTFMVLVASPTAFAVDADEPFAVQACPAELKVKPGGVVSLAFDYEVFKDHFIYRDMSSVTVTDAGGLALEDAVFPKGYVKFDKVSETEREIFEKGFQVLVEGTAPEGLSGKREVKVEVKWQGCNKPDNYCLFPETREVTCSVVVQEEAPSASSEVEAIAANVDAGSAEGSTDANAEASADANAEASADANAEASADANAGDTDTVGSETTGDEQPAAGAAPESEPEGVQPSNADSNDEVVVACAGKAGSAGAGATGIVSWVEGVLEGGEGSSFLAFLVLVFLGGLASSLTPCVYPMIPITISVIGASADQGKAKSFSLAVAYVLGIAATYTVLGLFAAYSGSLFGGMMQNPWVITGVSCVFFALAAAMFGFYEFALPSSLTTKASMVGGGGYGGAFIVGTVAGVVAAPCTGPVVALLLVKIASDYTMLQGVAIMLAFSLGLGQIFLVIGTFAGMLGSLPRSGTWMVEVKHLFGVVMVGVGIWYLGQILSESVMFLLWSGFLLIAAFELAGRMAAFKGPRDMRRVGAAAVLLVAGSVWLVTPLSDSTVSTVYAQEEVAWGSDHDAGASLSSTEGKPMIVDFTADWCAACKELEHFTYTDQAVISCAAEFVPVMIDGTEKTPEFERLRKKYKVVGLPAVYFVCPKGEVVSELTLKGFEPADMFLRKMNDALAACSSEATDAG